MVTSLTNDRVGTSVQLSVAVGTSPRAAVSPAASLHSSVRFNPPTAVVTSGATVSCTVSVCTKLALVFPQSSIKFHVRTRTYAFAQLGSGVLTSVTRFGLRLTVQLSLAAGRRASAAAIPTSSLHANTRFKLPATVLNTGAVVSRTVICCSYTALVRPQPSLKSHRRTRTYSFPHCASGVVVSLTRFSVGLSVQLSVAVGCANNAAANPAASLHSSVTSSAPGRVVTTGAVVSCTVIVCTKGTLVLPQPSVKFQLRTRVYPFAQRGFAVVTSDTKCKAELNVQLSVAVGDSATAAVRPAASLHSRIRSKLLGAVLMTGAVVSRTVMVWV